METNQDAFERTCRLAEDFADRDAGDVSYDPTTAALVIVITMEFIRERLGADATFEQLDPAALVAQLVRFAPSLIGDYAEVLRDFYTWLKATEQIDATRAQYLACYFDTLLELHGSGPTGILPTRASRRATATLARRITEARIRNDQRRRKARAA